MTKRETIVAITGASGSIYGLRLINELLKKRGDVNIIISPSGFLVIEHELGLKFDRNKEQIESALKRYFKNSKANLKYHPYDDLLSPLSSGSSPWGAARIFCCSPGSIP